MTYEEKLDRIVKALKEAKKLARKGYHPKLYYTADNGLKDINLNEIHDILLQLQDDEQIIKLQGIPTTLKSLLDQPADTLKSGTKNYFIVDILDTFDSWHEKRLIANKSRLENLSEINLINISHIMHLIEQGLELDQSEKLTISFISSAHEIEGYEPEDIDDIINTYVKGLTYLKNVGVIKDFTTAYMTLSSDLTLNIARFFEVLGQINSLGQNEKEKTKEPKTTTKIDRTAKKEAVWYDDFRWEGKDFVFGKYGSISFKSSDRKHILEVLTDKKGGWATINELKGNKDAGYVRSTIKQIEDRLPEKARKHIKIISTQDEDATEKPNVGAYRIKVLP